MKISVIPKIRSIRTRLILSMAATCVFLGIVLGSLCIIQISDVVEQNNEKILLEKVDVLYLKANAKLDMMAGFVDLYAKFAYREITDVKALISSEEYFKNYKRRMEIALKAMTSSSMHPKTLYYKFGRVHWPREGLFIVRKRDYRCRSSCQSGRIILRRGICNFKRRQSLLSS